MQTPDRLAEPLPIGSSNARWKIGPKEFIFKYLRYLPWIAVSIALFLFMAYIKIRYTNPIYKVQSSMLIKNDLDGPNSQKDQQFEELFNSQGTTNLTNEVNILKSRPVLQRVARDLNLGTRFYNKGSVKTSLVYPNPPFRLEVYTMADSSRGFNYKISVLNEDKFLLNENKTPSAFGQVVNKDGNSFRLVRDTAVDIQSFGSVFQVSCVPPAAATEGLIGALNVIQGSDQSTILTLTFECENINLGRDVLNTLMAVYDTLMVEEKNRIAGNTLRFINESLFELRDTLKGVQGGLRNFMVQNQVFDIGEQSKAYLNDVGESSAKKSELDVKVGVVDFLLKYISDKKNIYELVPTNLGIEEPALSLLITEYNRLQLDRESNIRTTSPTNPLIVGIENSLDKVRRDIYTALSNVKQAYTIAAENMNKREQAMRGQITSLPGKSMQMLNIERQQKILEELYSLLLQKQLEIRLSSASTISNSKVVEPAIGSGVPVSPDTRKIYTLYFVIGLLIPAGIIAVHELLKDKVSGRADVEKNTSAPILGEVGHSDNEQPLVVTQNSRRLISEQFRIIRTNLQYIINKKENPVVMITSSFSGEGKSFISTNMGAVMALSGKKTVIMEFDIRKPKILSGLELKRKMGITNYIIGKASFEELLIRVEGVDDLYVIPCGPIPPNPAELLLDKKLEELMKEVKAHFDVVIMDTAPVGLVSDATNLAKYADCTLYIVRQGYTFRKQLDFVEDLYISKKLPGLCLLLNDIKSEAGYYQRNYGSGYSYYGGYGNASGYFDEQSQKGGKKGLINQVKRWFKA